MNFMKCVESASIAMCENAKALNSCLDEKESIAAYMKLACSTVFVCLNYNSTNFSNDDFCSF